jgi:hypothetical protein
MPYTVRIEGEALPATFAYNTHSSNRVSHSAPQAFYGPHIISPVSAREIDTLIADRRIRQPVRVHPARPGRLSSWSQRLQTPLSDKSKSQPYESN